MEPNTCVCSPAHSQPHTCTVIFLHGRDSSTDKFGNELFESEASTDSPLLRAAGSPSPQNRTLPALFPMIRWVFPAAPLLYSQRFGVHLSQWFDMWSVQDPESRSEFQESGLRRSIRALLAVLETEEKLVPRSRIFLCGISQGFATALSLFLAEGCEGFAGLVGLCSWLPFSSRAEAHDLYGFNGAGDISTPDQLKKTPIFLGHALDDTVVPIENFRQMKNVLLQLGCNVELHEHQDGGHWVHEPQGVDDIAALRPESCDLSNHWH